MNKLKIIIVDDSPEICVVLRDELNAVPDFKVIKTISDPSCAVSEIRRLKPDILLLDVVMSPLDGDDILEELQGTISHTMGIIVLSPINNDITISRYSSLGAHCFISKPITAAKLMKKMNLLKESMFLENGTVRTDASGDDGEYADKRQKLTSHITRILLKTGVNPKLKGFCFIREGVNILCTPGTELLSVTKIIYPEIAHGFGTEPEKVERAIRTAIERAFTGGSSSFYYETLCESFVRKGTKPYPSNREFIFTIAEYIKHIEAASMIG